MPVLGNDLHFGPECVDALEAFRKSQVQWITYKYDGAKQRADLMASGPRLYDGNHPYARLRRIRKRRLAPKLSKDDEAELKREMAEALERRIAAAAVRTNQVGRPLPRYHPSRSHLIYKDRPLDPNRRRGGPRGDEDAWSDGSGSSDAGSELTDNGATGEGTVCEDDLPHEEPPLPPSFETLPVPLRFIFARFLDPDDALMLGLTSAAWYELTVSELVWNAMAVNLGVLSALDMRSIRRQRQACKAAMWSGGGGLPGAHGCAACAVYLICALFTAASAEGEERQRQLED